MLQQWEHVLDRKTIKGKQVLRAKFDGSDRLRLLRQFAGEDTGFGRLEM